MASDASFKRAGRERLEHADPRESGFFERGLEPSYAVYEVATGRWWLEPQLPPRNVRGLDPTQIDGAFEIDPGVWVVPLPRRSGEALPLTRRQAQIAELAAEGQTHRDIAERLGISAHTARTHLKNIYARLGVRTRMELVQLLESSRPAKGGAIRLRVVSDAG